MNCGAVRGACVRPSCEDRGRCHCGCGRPTSVPRCNNTRLGRRTGVPMAYAAGHAAGSNRGRRKRRHWCKSAELQWMAAALIEYHGSLREATRVVGVDKWCLKGVAEARHQHVKFGTEDRVRKAFAEIDRLPRVSLPVEPLRTFLAARGIGPHVAFDDEAIEKAYSRGRISFPLADEAATRLGVHPGDLWGDLYWEVA